MRELILISTLLGRSTSEHLDCYILCLGSKLGKIVDLFCGAGGFSLGAHLVGFQTAAAIDFDSALTSSFTENFPTSRLFRLDVAAVTGMHILEMAGLKAREIVGVVGGPPCQGFSLIGKRSIADPRNLLVDHFFRVVRELEPKFFIMENVPGLLVGEPRNILERALSRVRHHYRVLEPLLVDASEYGAATRRERVVIIGYNENEVKAIAKANVESIKSARRYTVADAIKDLPEPDETDWSRYAFPKSESSRYARRARDQPVDGLGAPFYAAQLARGYVSGLLPTAHTRVVASRFRSVKPGMRESVSRCPRLSWDQPSPTLRAGTGPEKGSFQSIRPIHPIADRVITVREAARLQGFPDWFKFHETKWHSFRMIGNSVSPAVSQRLLALLADSIS